MAGLSKKLRFEVFKRDSFTCQYCGRKAPDVVLQVDHIEPVSKGGSNEILNLVTSCFDCNSGKSDRTLDDSTIVEKRRNQIEMLQERREQLDMLLQWHKGLLNQEGDEVDALVELFVESIDRAYTLNESGIDLIRQCHKRAGFQETLECMKIAIRQYVKTDKLGKYTQESVNEALNKLNGIQIHRARQKKDPHYGDASHIASVLRKRLSYFPRGTEETYRISHLLKLGVAFDDLMSFARTCRNWTEWKDFREKYDASPEA